MSIDYTVQYSNNEFHHLSREVNHTPQMIDTPLGQIEASQNTPEYHRQNIARLLHERTSFTVSDPWLRYTDSEGAFRVRGFDTHRERDLYDLESKSPEFWINYPFKERAKAEVKQVVNAEKLVAERPDGPLSWITLSPPDRDYTGETGEGKQYFLMAFVVTRTMIPNEYDAFQIYYRGNESESAEDLQNKANVFAALLDPKFVEQHQSKATSTTLIEKQFVLQDAPDEIQKQILLNDGRLDKEGIIALFGKAMGQEIRNHEQERQDFAEIITLLDAEGSIDRFITTMVERRSKEEMQMHYNHLLNRFDYLMHLYQHGESLENITEIALLTQHVSDFSMPGASSTGDERNNSTEVRSFADSPFEIARRNIKMEKESAPLQEYSGHDIVVKPLLSQSPVRISSIPWPHLTWRPTIMTSSVLRAVARSLPRLPQTIQKTPNKRPVKPESQRKQTNRHLRTTNHHTQKPQIKQMRSNPDATINHVPQGTNTVRMLIESKTKNEFRKPKNTSSHQAKVYYFMLTPRKPNPQRPPALSRTIGRHIVRNASISHHQVDNKATQSAHHNTIELTHKEQRSQDTQVTVKTEATNKTPAITKHDHQYHQNDVQGREHTRNSKADQAQTTVQAERSTITKLRTSAQSGLRVEAHTEQVPKVNHSQGTGARRSRLSTGPQVIQSKQSQVLYAKREESNLSRLFTPHQCELLERMATGFESSESGVYARLTPARARELARYGLQLTAIEHGVYFVTPSKIFIKQQ